MSRGVGRAPVDDDSTMSAASGTRRVLTWRRLRPWALVVHRWLGLTAGVVFAVAAATGAVLVYADELDVLLAGPRFHTTPGEISVERLQAALSQQAPGADIVRVIWPLPPSNTFAVRVRDGGRQRDLVVDAGSGRILTPRAQHLSLVLIRRLHAGLLIGPAGGLIVMAASAASVLSMLAGILLWWPGLRRLAGGFRVRFTRGLYSASHDLHQVLGLLATPLLVVMALTGLAIDPAIHGLVSRMLHGAPAASAWTGARSAVTDGGRIDLSTAARVATETTGGAVRHVSFPVASDGIVEVRLRLAGRSERLALDRYSGRVLVRQPLRYDPETNASLHFGWLGGPVVRALYVLTCIVGALLLPTGVFLWWWKRRPRGQRQPGLPRSVEPQGCE